MYQKPQPMSKNKKIEIAILVALIMWGIVFVINYVRYTHKKSLIFAIHITAKNYDDGEVEEYISLGYTYRMYRRTAITKEELVPFWVLRQNPKALPDLPVMEDDYNVPENRSRKEKYRGLLYYYNSERELIGTYKCVNTDIYCEKATGGHDEYDIVGKDPLTKTDPHVLEQFYDRFAFIDDSAKQDIAYGEAGYIRTVYLYQLGLPKGVKTEADETYEAKILAKYADVKESNLDEEKLIASGDNYQFIVKSMDNNKWGIIKVSKEGEIEQVIPFEYESINYDRDTGYYIMKKTDSWYVYDLKKNEKVSAESYYPIYNVWKNDNQTYYFKNGQDRTVGEESFIDFKIYRLDGTTFLDSEHISCIGERGSYIMYITSNNNVLHFIDYGKTEKYKVQLKFSRMDYDEFSNPAFKIVSERDTSLRIDVYNGRALGTGDPEHLFINTGHWEWND